MKTYYIGLLKDYTNPRRIILNVSPTLDGLNCEIWKFYGERETTKETLRRNRKEILEHINRVYQTNYRTLVIE